VSYKQYIIGISVLFFALCTPVLAQKVVVPQETIHINAGDLLEILPITDIEVQPTYSWILTQDRTFVQSGQNATFRKRILQPGSYTLNAEITRGKNILRRKFVINVMPKDQDIPGKNVRSFVMKPAENETLVKPIPKPNKTNTIVLSESEHIVKLIPNEQSSPYFLDADPFTDTNGDSDPLNDHDAPQTFFEEDQSPIHLWFTSPLTKRTIIIHTVASDGSRESQSFDVASKDFALKNGLVTSHGHIQAGYQGMGNVQFDVHFDGDHPPDIPLLFEWDFGDTEQNLTQNPLHQYAFDGDYDVTLRIRDLESNQELGTSALQITLTGYRSRQDADVITDPPGDTIVAQSQTSVITLLAIGVSIVVGIGLFVAIIACVMKKLRSGKGIAKTVEALEKKVVKGDDKKKELVEPSPEETTDTKEPTKKPPLEIKSDDTPQEQSPPQDTETDTESQSPPVSVPPPTPPAAEEPAPEWLKEESDPMKNASIHKPADAAGSMPSWLSKGIEKAHTEETFAKPEEQSPFQPPPQSEPPAPPPPITEPNYELEKEEETIHAPGIQATDKAEPLDMPTPPPSPEPPPPPQAEDIQTPLPASAPIIKPPTQEAPQDISSDDEAAQREKKRLKRQRYRKNVKERKRLEKEVASDAPLSPVEPSPPQEAPPSPPKVQDIPPLNPQEGLASQDASQDSDDEPVAIVQVDSIKEATPQDVQEEPKPESKKEPDVDDPFQQSTPPPTE
jgi:PKD repeat protein